MPSLFGQPFFKELEVERAWVDRALGRAGFLDIETHGLDERAKNAAIHEAAFIKREGAGYKTVFNTHVNPLKHRWEEGLQWEEAVGWDELTPWTSNVLKENTHAQLVARASAGERTGNEMVDRILFPENGTLDTGSDEFKELVNQVTKENWEYRGVVGAEGTMHPRELLNVFHQQAEGDIWVHNLKFESRWFGEYTTPEEFLDFIERSKLQSFNPEGQNRMFRTSPLIEEAIGLTNRAQTKEEFLEAWENVWTKGFAPELEKASKTTRIFDLQELYSSTLAMAQRRGYMSPTGDVFSGTNLNVASQLLFGAPEAHEAMADVRLSADVAEHFLAINKTMAEGKELSEEAKFFFRSLEELQPQIKYRSQLKTLLGAQKAIKEGKGWRAVKKPIFFDLPTAGWNEEGEQMTREMRGKKRLVASEYEYLFDMGKVKNRIKQRAVFGETIDYNALFQDVDNRGWERMSLSQLGTEELALDAETKALLSKSVGRQIEGGVEEPLLRRGGRMMGGAFKGLKGKALPIGIGVGAALLAINLFSDDKADLEETDSPLIPVSPYSPLSTRADIVRASMIGKPTEEIVSYMKGESEDLDAFGTAATEAGTALHRYLQKYGINEGDVDSVEQLLWDPQNRVTGHYDIRYKTGEIEDIKTVSPKRWNQIISQGPDPSHMQQVNFYGIIANAPAVSLRYVQADKPEKVRKFTFAPSLEMYEASMGKVAEARRMVEETGGAVPFSPLASELGEKWDKFQTFYMQDMSDTIAEYGKERTEYKEALREKNSKKFSGKDDDYNTLEGMPHGWFGKGRRFNTDFGSGYLRIAFTEIIPEAGDAYIAQNIRRALREKIEYTQISGRDDDYLNQEGMPHGWVGRERRFFTDFGSGYQALKKIPVSLPKPIPTSVIDTVEGISLQDFVLPQASKSYKTPAVTNKQVFQKTKGSPFWEQDKVTISSNLLNGQGRRHTKYASHKSA